MSSRSRAAFDLGRALTRVCGVECEVTYHGQRKTSYGGWHVEWGDGPTRETMQETIERLRPRFPEFTGMTLWCDRGGHEVSQMAALLAFLEAHPERLGDEFISSTSQRAWDDAEYPERLPEETLTRARALCNLDPELIGMMSSRTGQALRERCLQGWDAVVEWVDGIVAAQKDPAVTDLAAERRRRAGNQAAGGAW